MIPALDLLTWRRIALGASAVALALCAVFVVSIGRMNAAERAQADAMRDLTLVRAHQSAAQHVAKVLRLANAEERQRVTEAWDRINALKAQLHAVPRRVSTPVMVDAVPVAELRETLRIVRDERDGFEADAKLLRVVADNALAEANLANVEAMQRMVRDSARLVELSTSLDSATAITGRAQKKLKPSRLARIGRGAVAVGKAAFWFVAGRESRRVMP